MTDGEVRKMELNRALRKIMDLQSRRDHSEKELTQKLKKFFLDSTICSAIQEAKERKWLSSPEEIAERSASILGRRLKGSHYIQNHLKKRGLPKVAIDPDFELEKALALVKNKYKIQDQLGSDEKPKVARFLVSRGFDMDTIRKVIYEKF